MTYNTFQERVIKRDRETIYAIDFFAPWCRPCQEFAFNWRRLARSMKEAENIHIAQVNCQAESKLCDEEGIRSYPTIRLYSAKKDKKASF